MFRIYGKLKNVEISNGEVMSYCPEWLQIITQLCNFAIKQMLTDC